MTDIELRKLQMFRKDKSLFVKISLRRLLSLNLKGIYKQVQNFPVEKGKIKLMMLITFTYKKVRNYPSFFSQFPGRNLFILTNKNPKWSTEYQR
jgi:hypothetical protein